jgi:WD40 repeat protein/tRNA A-37 threonylcarbamoyl transferase component Bud32
LLESALAGGHGPGAAQTPSDEQPAGQPGILRYFGDYALLQEIAEGGMGVVYKARQISLSRTVALKLIRSGRLASPSEVVRFRTEAEAAANLDHPNIVPVIEVGEHEGRHYYSMKFVPGQNLAQRMAERPLPEEESARLLAAVARAVHHAHQHGVIHRDIKPTNILVDAQGVPYLVDFGLAKLLAGSADATQTVALLGTPHYMAPEQALAAGKGVSTKADVYSLGAVLYEMLAGRPPFQGESVLQILEQIRLGAPRPLREFNPQASRDLETICLKCLEKNPAGRYASAEALAEDLDRWLRREPIQARPATPLERLHKWVQRNPAVSALAAVLVSTLLAGLFATSWEWRLVRQRELEARERAYAADMRNAQVALEKENRGQARALLRNHLPQRGQPDLRGVEWRYLWQASRGQEIRLYDHGAMVHGMAISPDGRWLVTSGQDGRARSWNVSNSVVAAEFPGLNPLDPGLFDAFNQTVATSPVGELFAVASADGVEVRRFGSCALVTNLHSATFPVEFSPDGRLLAALACAPQGLALRIWKVGSWESRLVSTNISRHYLAVRFSGDQRHLLWCHEISRDINVFDTHDNREERKLPGSDGMLSLAVSPDDRWIAVGSLTGQIRVLDFATGEAAATWRAHPSLADAVAFSPDSQTLASGGDDQVIRLWKVGTWETQGTLAGHESEIWDIAYVRDGQSLFSAGKDGTVRQFPAHSAAPILKTNLFSANYVHLMASEQGDRLLALGADMSIERWDLNKGAPLESRRLPIGRPAIYSALVVPGIWAASDPNGEIVLLDADARDPVMSHRTGIKRPRLLDLTPDGRHLLAQDSAEDGKPGSLFVWNLALNRLEARLDQGTFYAAGGLSPDGHYAAAFSGKSNEAFLWAVDQPRPVSMLRGHTYFLSCLAFSSDVRLVAVGSYDGTVRVWDVRSGHEVLPQPTGHRSGLAKIQFSNDGRTLVTFDANTVRFWNLKTGQEMLHFEGVFATGVLSRDNGSLSWWSVFGQSGSRVWPDGRVRFSATRLPTLAEIDVIEKNKARPEATRR